MHDLGVISEAGFEIVDIYTDYYYLVYSPHIDRVHIMPFYKGTVETYFAGRISNGRIPT